MSIAQHYDAANIGGGGGFGFGSYGGGGVLEGILLASLIGRGGFGFGGRDGGVVDHQCCDARVEAVRAEAAILAANAAGNANIITNIDNRFSDISEALCDIRTSEAETKTAIAMGNLATQAAIKDGNQLILNAITQSEINSLRDDLGKERAANSSNNHTQIVVNAIAQSQAQAQASNNAMMSQLFAYIHQNAQASNRTVQFGAGNVAAPVNSATNVN